MYLLLPAYNPHATPAHVTPYVAAMGQALHYSLPYTAPACGTVPAQPICPGIKPRHLRHAIVATVNPHAGAAYQLACCAPVGHPHAFAAWPAHAQALATAIHLQTIVLNNWALKAPIAHVWQAPGPMGGQYSTGWQKHRGAMPWAKGGYFATKHAWAQANAMHLLALCNQWVTLYPLP